jgi:RNA polymerase sigma-70 factor (ECF subfamily)
LRHDEDAVETLRSRLFGLAYRMLGSRSEAEDAVQEAFLRWHRGGADGVRSPEAWLVTVVTRLCIDRLRALAKERETYIGPWLAEPIIGENLLPDHAAELASDLSMALLLVLERLAPEERAAFLMHEVFECGYADIAAALGRSEAACRQLVHRARERVRRDKPRFEVSEAAHRRLVEQYVQAIQARDPLRIAALLAPDSVFISDGGGKAWAALRPVTGAQRIARMEMGVVRRLLGRFSVLVLSVNGRTGVVGFLDGRAYAVTSFETDGLRILSVMRVLNPEKLSGLTHLAGLPSQEFA